MSPGIDGGDITEALITSPSGINPEPKSPMHGKGGTWERTEWVYINQPVYLFLPLPQHNPPPHLTHHLYLQYHYIINILKLTHLLITSIEGVGSVMWRNRQEGDAQALYGGRLLQGQQPCFPFAASHSHTKHTTHVLLSSAELIKGQGLSFASP